MSQLITRSEWYAGVPRSARSQTLFGYSLLAIALFGFGYWSSSAPIAGAVVAPGVFVATGQNKIVQHLEGGVIRDILVREGDKVESGQLLIRLDDTAPKAELQRLALRHARQSAIEARLQAEIHDRAEFVFPTIVGNSVSSADWATILENQRMTFQARRRNMQNEVAALEEGIGALDQRVQGTKIQLGGVHRQLEFIRQELDAKSHLLQGGLIRKPEVLALERARANLEGEIGRLTGEIGNAQEQIARTREQIALVRNSAIKGAVEQLHEVAAELNDLRERIHASERVLERINITAPVRGIVVKMRYHTPGGVVEAGKNILEIVPVEDELVLEVRVRPQDIEGVKGGQEATVRLTALNRRITPTLTGRVVYVSADAVPNEKPGQQQPPSDVYVARIKLDPGEVAAVHNFDPSPGMPAEVYIKTEERTFLDYLLRPLKDSMSRAFRES